MRGKITECHFTKLCIYFTVSYTVLFPIKDNSNTMELTVHTFCYSV